MAVSERISGSGPADGVTSGPGSVPAPEPDCEPAGEPSLDLAQDFAGRPGCALVIGGTGGIGSVICTELARRGSDVAFTYRSAEARAAELAEHIRGHGRQAWASAVDLADHRAAAAAVDAAAEAAAGLHTVVYAAGPEVPQRHLSSVDPALAGRFLQVDAAAFVALAQAAIPQLRRSQGSIVAVTTAAIRRHPVRDALSTIPKAAVEAAVRAIAAEEGRFGVRANTVGPGMLTDGMARRLMASGDLDSEALEAARAAIALRRFGRAADIAEAVCFLASDRAGFVSGQHLAVDGGYTV